ncbi:hypothetical protein [Parasitella parasitica]|uniref:Uncharacterized protein n=1 Tax=Parasitella parasitica TaxID=35722 RepID=A0A0B7NLN6_9FUNG|nr:hypothetical protein [Parasitella parasitica]
MTIPNQSKEHDTPTAVPFASQLIQKYLWPGTSFDIIIQSVRTLDFDRIYVRLDSPTAFDPLVIFIVALAEMWKAHRRFLFGAVTLTTDSLFASFQRALTTMQTKDNLLPSAG